MITTAVAYHADFGRNARPAINVKMHVAGQEFWPAEFTAAYGHGDDYADDNSVPGNFVEAAYQRVISDFWQAAQEIATQRGLGEIEQEGRSGGWLVFADRRLTGLLEDAPNGRRREAREFLEAYRAMSEWVREYLAAAPARVSRLAQDMAMDKLGSRAVNQVRP